MEQAAEVAEIKVKKNTRKASRKVKEAAEVVEEKAKTGTRKAKAAKLDNYHPVSDGWEHHR